MKTNRFRLLAASAAMLALVGAAAACGDDGGDASSGTEAAPFEFVSLDSGGPNTKAALEKGDIDIAVLYSSDGSIAKNDWVALADDKRLQPVDNFIPAVYTPSTNPGVEAALNAVSEALTAPKVQEMVGAVSVDGENPDDVAAEFLKDVTIPAGATGDLAVGSGNFAESEVVAEVYAQALKSSGANVDVKLDFGAREVYLPALQKGDLDVVPEFVGTLLTKLDPAASPSTDLAATVMAARTLAAAQNVTLLDPAPADSVNTFVVTQATADKYDLANVSDLAKVKDALKLGGPPECPDRIPCIKGLISVYGLKFAS